MARRRQSLGDDLVTVEFEDIDRFVEDLRVNARESARLSSGRFGKQNRLPVELERAYLTSAKVVVKEARSLGRTHGKMLEKASESIRVVRVPGGGSVVTAGGPEVVFSGKGSYTQVFFGADFGSVKYKQFPAVRRKGRTIYPAWDNKERQIDRIMLDAFDKYWGKF